MVNMSILTRLNRSPATLYGPDIYWHSCLRQQPKFTKLKYFVTLTSSHGGVKVKLKYMLQIYIVPLVVWYQHWRNRSSSFGGEATQLLPVKHQTFLTLTCSHGGVKVKMKYMLQIYIVASVDWHQHCRIWRRSEHKLLPVKHLNSQNRSILWPWPTVMEGSRSKWSAHCTSTLFPQLIGIIIGEIGDVVSEEKRTQTTTRQTSKFTKSKFVVTLTCSHGGVNVKMKYTLHIYIVPSVDWCHHWRNRLSSSGGEANTNNYPSNI